jgi:hypothetical protein
VVENIRTNATEGRDLRGVVQDANVWRGSDMETGGGPQASRQQLMVRWIESYVALESFKT